MSKQLESRPIVSTAPLGERIKPRSLRKGHGFTVFPANRSVNSLRELSVILCLPMAVRWSPSNFVRCLNLNGCPCFIQSLPWCGGVGQALRAQSGINPPLTPPPYLRSPIFKMLDGQKSQGDLFAAIYSFICFVYRL